MLPTAMLLVAILLFVVGFPADAGPITGSPTTPPPVAAKVVLHCLTVDSTGVATDPDSAAVLDEAVLVLNAAPTATVVLADPVECPDSGTAPRFGLGQAQALQEHLRRRGFTQARVASPNASALTEGARSVPPVGANQDCRRVEGLCPN